MPTSLWVRLVFILCAAVALAALGWYLWRLYGPAAILAPVAAITVGAGAITGARKIAAPDRRPRRGQVGAVEGKPPVKPGEPEPPPRRPRRGGF